jgi:predicted dehydrogenase
MKTIGVIGLGSIGMRHAKNLISLGHAVIGFDPITVGDRFPSMWPVRRINEVDGVVLSLPSNQHCAEILETPDHVPIFVEKPIGVCAGDFEYLPAAINRIRMVGYNLRFHSCVKKAKEWLDAGLIGEPTWASFTCAQYNDRPPYLRDGVILNWSHEIDLALYLLGPASVAASSTHLTDGKDDMTDILLTHEGGCRSSIHLDYVTKQEIRGFTIAGTKTSITVNLVAGILSFKRDYGDNLPDITFCSVNDWNENYIEEMQAFINRIDDKETIGCTGEEGLRVLEICLEVRKQAGL